MTRMPRINVEGALYYITSRGDHEQSIFRDDADYKAYLELLKKCKERYGFKLFAFMLMPNHLHLLIELKKGVTISDIMFFLNSTYTKYFNSRYQKKGHLFQERYRMVIAEKEPYLLALTAYIHLNPSKLGLAPQLQDYAYSSFLYYIGRGPRSVEINMEQEKSEIGSRALAAGSRLEDFITSVPKEEVELLAKELGGNTILGSEGFMEKVKAQAKERAAVKEQKPGRLEDSPFVVAGTWVLILLAALTVYLYTKESNLKAFFARQMANKEKEIAARLAKEKAKIYQDLDEKYRADSVSFAAMSKRLEIEKNRVKELEAKVR